MKAPGKLVKVNDTYMHVYRVPQAASKRQGTLVFLSGYGTECPTYDFKPLWSILTGECTMVVVERPGYGWSGETKLQRDINTILEETRKALRKADVPGPFIPVPHSIAGLEALYWAQKYPDEVMAIIGLDMAVPQIYDAMELPRFFSLAVKAAHLLRRPIACAMVKSHPAVKSNILNKEEQAAMRSIVSKQLLSKNMIDESGYVKENARKVADNECPCHPVLCCLSNDKQILKRIPIWGKAHHDYFAGNPNITFIEIPCGHYLHREKPETTAKSILEFLG